MEQLYITNLTIKKVRHLKEISIPFSENQIRHLILTGKNGSGKTSVVEALAVYLNNACRDQNFEDKAIWLNDAEKERDKAVQSGREEAEILKLEKEARENLEQLEQSRNGN